jgi:F-type H+-transporting ATPase subunit epsilon
VARGTSFLCSVVTPEGPAFEREAKSAVFPAYDGEIGILPGHAPLLTKLGIGVLRVTAADGGGSHRLYVDGGFAQVGDGKLTLLTEQASALEDLDASAVPGLFEKAEAIKPEDAESLEAREAAFERARVQRRLTR